MHQFAPATVNKAKNTARDTHFATTFGSADAGIDG
jgi:hypothetical protein